MNSLPVSIHSALILFAVLFESTATASYKQPDRRSELISQVQQITRNESPIKEITVGSETLKVGDRAPVTTSELVTVMNLKPIKTNRESFYFGIGTHIRGGATVSILGFTDDRKQVLVKYSEPMEVGKGDPPAGIQFFLTVERYLRLFKEREERNKLKREVEKIVEGKSTIKSAKIADRTLSVGDTAPISQGKWVDVMNLTPVTGRNVYHRYTFKHIGDLEKLVVEDGGTIKILGITEDRSRALVEYQLPMNKQAGGTQAPSGIQYFIDLKRFARLEQENRNRRKEIAELRATVTKIVEGNSKLKEITVDDRTLSVGETKTISTKQWVHVMNLTPVQSRNSSFVFKEWGGFSSCLLWEGGTVSILGFSDDQKRILVEYTLPEGIEAGGTKAPSGIQYFMTVEDFTGRKTTEGNSTF